MRKQEVIFHKIEIICWLQLLLQSLVDITALRQRVFLLQIVEDVLTEMSIDDFHVLLSYFVPLGKP
jgi:hypothetical protein